MRLEKTGGPRAGMFLPWALCYGLEPLRVGQDVAFALFRERDQRLARRQRALKGRDDDDGAAAAEPPRLEVRDAARLYKCDWQDADVALFDATRAEYCGVVDEGCLLRDVLWPGLAAALAGTVVLVITRDLNPTMRRALPAPSEGDAACELLETCVMSCGTTGETLRLDVLKVVSATNDPRIAPKPADVAPPPKLLLEIAKAHRSHKGLMKHIGYAPGKKDHMFKDGDATDDSDDDDDGPAKLRRSSSLEGGDLASVRSHGLQLLGMMRKNISGRPSLRHGGAG